MVLLYCDICNINIQKNMKARHLRTKKHRLNDPNTPKFYCYICEKDMLLERKEEHEHSEKHKINEQKLLPFYGVTIEDTWKCEICD